MLPTAAETVRLMLHRCFTGASRQPLSRRRRACACQRHDMLAAPCSAEMYRALGWQDGYHPRCSDNFRKAADSIGWHPEHVPDPDDFFQNTPVGPEESITALPAVSRAGDSVAVLRSPDSLLGFRIPEVAGGCGVGSGQCLDRVAMTVGEGQADIQCEAGPRLQCAGSVPAREPQRPGTTARIHGVGHSHPVLGVLPPTGMHLDPDDLAALRRPRQDDLIVFICQGGTGGVRWRT